MDEDKPRKRQRISESDTPGTPNEVERLGESSNQVMQPPTVQSSTPAPRGIFDSSKINAIMGGRFTQTSGHHASLVVHFHQHNSGTQVDVDLHDESGESVSSKQANVPKTKRSRRRTRRSPTASNSQLSRVGFIPVIRPNQIYEQHLLTKGRGYPLWIPECSLTLPTKKQKIGICVGDVGLITSSGGFSFLFNITLPVDHEFHPALMPEGFHPIEASRRGNTLTFRELKPRSSLTSVSIKELNPGSDTRIGEQIFQSSSSDGAILTLPDGAVSDEMEGLGFWRKYMADNIESWYIYVNGTLGREAENGDIRLVVGCDKTSAWGMAAAGKQVLSSQPYQLRFRAVEAQNSPIRHVWECTGVVDARTGPSTEELRQLAQDSGTAPNEYLCVFVRTLNATVSDEAWANITNGAQLAMGYGGQDTSNNTLHGGPSSTTSVTGHGESVSGYGNIASWTGTRSYANIDLGGGPNDNHRLYTDTHPADVLNRFLLYQQPDAKIAFTCDDDWRRFLDEGTPDRVLDDDELISVALVNRLITHEQGVSNVYFTDNSEQHLAQLSPLDWPNLEELIPTPDSSKEPLHKFRHDSQTGLSLPDPQATELPLTRDQKTGPILSKSAEVDVLLPLLRALTTLKYNVVSHNQIQQQMCPNPDLELFKDFSPTSSRILQQALTAFSQTISPHLQASPGLLSQFKTDDDKISFAQTLLKKLISTNSDIKDLRASIESLSLDDIIRNRFGGTRQMHPTCRPDYTQHILLVYITGLRGSDTEIFNDFPQVIETRLGRMMSYVRAESVIYPAHQVKDKLSEAIPHFIDWLTALTIERETAHGNSVRMKVVLFGHSTGGLLVADALRELHQANVKEDSPTWPCVIACIALDTPYFGVSPDVAPSLNRTVNIVNETATELARPLAMLGLAAPLAAGFMAGEAGVATGLALALSGFGGLAGAALLAAGGLASVYRQNRARTPHTSWVANQMTYFDNLQDEMVLQERVKALVKMERDAGVLFKMIYTQLPSTQPSTRTFAVLPGSESEAHASFVPVVNSIASDEMQAHLGMLSLRTNDGYMKLVDICVKIVGGALTKESS